MDPAEEDKVVEVPKTDVLHTVTPLSKYLAMILFTVLPFIGGWIGYEYGKEKTVLIEVPVQSQDIGVISEFSGAVTNEWITLPLCEVRENLKEITFPSDLDIKLSIYGDGEFDKNSDIVKSDKCFDLKYEYHPYVDPESYASNKIINVSVGGGWSEPSTLIYTIHNNQQYERYIADGQNKRLVLIDSATEIPSEDANDFFRTIDWIGEDYLMGGLLNGAEDYLYVYRWPTDSGVVSKVFSLADENEVYEDECIDLGNLGPFAPAIKDNYRQEKLVYMDCGGAITVTDFNFSTVLEIPNYVLKPYFYGFTDDGKIKFYDLDTSDEALRHPVYSINFDGTEFEKEEETRYGGF